MLRHRVIDGRPAEFITPREMEGKKDLMEENRRNVRWMVWIPWLIFSLCALAVVLGWMDFPHFVLHMASNGLQPEGEPVPFWG
jgi:predicted nucleic acid-binding Zn ribbon protein